MRNFFLPIAVIIFGATLYHIAQKSIPKTANPLFVMVVAYVTGITICIVGSYFYPANKSVYDSIKELNWAVYAVGVGAIAIEIGFLFAYRAGWNISLTAFLTTVAVTMLLVPIGILIYKENITKWNVVGMVLALIGLYLMSKK
jgi:drug/metabolite transporter (DMT)-like permease